MSDNKELPEVWVLVDQDDPGSVRIFYINRFTNLISEINDKLWHDMGGELGEIHGNKKDGYIELDWTDNIDITGSYHCTRVDKQDQVGNCNV